MASLGILHALADTIAKDVEGYTPEKGDPYRAHLQNLKSYYPYWVQSAQKPLLRGDQILNYFKIPPTFTIGDPPVKVVDYVQS